MKQMQKGACWEAVDLVPDHRGNGNDDRPEFGFPVLITYLLYMYRGDHQHSASSASWLLKSCDQPPFPWPNPSNHWAQVSSSSSCLPGNALWILTQKTGGFIMTWNGLYGHGLKVCYAWTFSNLKYLVWLFVHAYMAWTSGYSPELRLFYDLLN